MSVQVFCPKCDHSCRIPEQYLGKRVRCPYCKEAFKAEDVPTAEPDDAPEPSVNRTARSASPALAVEASKLRPQPSPAPEKRKPSEPERAPAKPTSDKTIPAPAAVATSEPEPLTSPLADDSARSAAPIAPEKWANPFVDSTTLAAPEVDPSAFEFDFGGEEPNPKKKPASDRKKPTDPPKKSDRRPVEPEPPSDGGSPFSFNGDGGKPAVPGKIKKEQTPERAGDANGAAKKREGSPSPKPVDREETPSRDENLGNGKRASVKKTAVGSDDSTASFFGLDNLSASSPHVEDEASLAFSGFGQAESPSAAASAKTEEKKSPALSYFHLRQADFWSEVRLFRVFVESDGLVFIAAATGSDVAVVEKALRAKESSGFEKRIRNRLRDLDELSIDELLDHDDTSFSWSAEKITEATIEAPQRKSSAETCSAVLRLLHKTKGAVTFDLVADDDVDRAFEFLPDLFDEILEVNVRWDKTSKRFVAK